jgi:hypothetical protein
MGCQIKGFDNCNTQDSPRCLARRWRATSDLS